MSVNKTRAALLRDAAATVTDTGRRVQLTTAAALIAALPDSQPHPSDRPLFDRASDLR